MRSHAQPQEKLCALRHCVERILIDKPSGSVIVKIKAVPVSEIKEVEDNVNWTRRLATQGLLIEVPV